MVIDSDTCWVRVMCDTLQVRVLPLLLLLNRPVYWDTNEYELFPMSVTVG